MWWAAPAGGHRQRQRDELACLEGHIGVTASGQLAPAMNDVCIDAVCHGDLGYRCPGLGALRHHLRLRHRAVPPPRVRLLACHRVHLNLDAHDPCRLAARNQDDLAGRIPTEAPIASHGCSPCWSRYLTSETIRNEQNSRGPGYAGYGRLCLGAIIRHHLRRGRCRHQ
jgi:hypothetical protein